MNTNNDGKTLRQRLAQWPLFAGKNRKARTAAAPAAQAPAVPPTARATGAVQNATAWALIFDHVEANPIALGQLALTCRTFAELAARNARWAPYSPLEALMLPTPRLQAASGSVPTHLVPQTDPYLVPGTNVNVAPGSLRQKFLQRQSALQTAAQHCPLVADARRCMLVVWHLPLQTPPPAGARGAAPEASRAFNNILDRRLKAALARNPHNYDLARAHCDFVYPQRTFSLGLLAEALQLEPSLFATCTARRPGIYGAEAYALCSDLDKYWDNVAAADTFAYTKLPETLRARLDVAVWAAKHHISVLHALPPALAAGADYAAARRRVPQDSPLFTRADDAALLQRIDSFAALKQLAES